MGNLFSSFDPQVRIYLFSLGLNWLSVFRGVVFLPQIFWLRGRQMKNSLKFFIMYLLRELGSIFRGLVIPGTMLIFLSLFFFILFSNFLGLLPYVFTPSRHIVYSLILALPLWLGNMIWSLTFQFKSVMAHLVPLGTPVALIPVMVIIETVRTVIRPATLAIRLAANIIAGHLLLTLLGSQGRSAGSRRVVFIFLRLTLLLILECAVACIQSYVFTVLSSLYFRETVRVGFLKNNQKF